MRTTNTGKTQFTLGEIIDFLKSLNAPDDTNVEFDFCWASPQSTCSWRGAYEELAIVASFSSDGIKCTLKSFIEMLEKSLKEVFEGWKGGEYKMTRETPVWITDAPGHNCKNVITGISYYNEEVILHTDICDY
jgi:hypothetical protein